MHTTGTVQHRALRPSAAQESTKSATVVRSDSAVMFPSVGLF